MNKDDLKRYPVAEWIISIMVLGMVTGCNSPSRVIDLGAPLNSSRSESHYLKIRSKNNENQHEKVADAKIRIIEIQIKSKSGNWYRFQVNPFDLNLLKPGASLNQALARGSIDQKITFDEVRLITEDFGSAHFKDGRSVALRVPSGSQSGLKLHFDQDIDCRDGKVSIAKIEFDVSKSFVVPGNESEVLFKPVVRTSVEFVSSDEEDENEAEHECEENPSPTPSPSPSSEPSPAPSSTPTPVPSPSSTPVDSGSTGGSGSTTTDPISFPPIIGV